MKKKSIYNCVAGVGVILLAICSFLKCWAFDFNGTIDADYTYSIWGGFQKEVANFFVTANDAFNSIWATLAMILFVVALVAGVAYIVLALLSCAKKGNEKKFRPICLVLAVTVLVAGLLSFVSGAILFNTANTYTETVLNNDVVYQMLAQTGMYLIAVGSLIAGVFGILASKKK